VARDPHLPHLPRAALIDAYGKGGFRFAGMAHRGSLLCLPNGIWAASVVTAADISEEALAPVFANSAAIDYCLIGAGASATVLPEPLRVRFRECGIAVGYGFCELHRGTHYNTFALVGPDGLLGLQRKVHASDDEFFRFRQAYEWSVVDLGFCTVGTAICHDSDFFESWRILAVKGAELVLLPHANRTMPAGGGALTFDGRGRQVPEEELLRAQQELLEARPDPPRLHDVMARDNGVYAVFSDQVGFDGHSSHVGGAYVLAPDGSLLARSEIGTGNGWICADLDPALLQRARENPWFALRKRRPEAYEELTARL